MKPRKHIRGLQFGGVPHYESPNEHVSRTENEETRRKARDWLRDRDEDDVPEFEDEE